MLQCWREARVEHAYLKLTLTMCACSYLRVNLCKRLSTAVEPKVTRTAVSIAIC
jgi:hypothetical protein